MKNPIKNTLFTGTIAFALASCATPKVADIPRLNPIPKEYENPEVLSQELGISLRTYFQDEHLLSLFDEVIKANPDYLIAQQRLEIANSFLSRANMAFLPSLEVGAIASGERYGKYTMEGVGNFDTNFSQNIEDQQRVNEKFTPNYRFGLRSAWEIDLWGKLKNQKLSAQKKYLASMEGIRLIQVELFTDIALLYYQLISLDQKLLIYQKNYTLQQRAYEIVSAQREVGKATELAVQQFRAHNNNLLAEIEKIKVEIVAVEKAITTLTGKYGGEVARGKELLSTNMELLARPLDVSAIIHTRPDVISNYYVLEASQADAKAARAAFYPKVDLAASFGLNSFSAPTFFNASSLVGQLLGGLVQPIFNKGQLKHEFNVANKEQEIAFLTYQKSVTTAFNELQSILKQTEIYHKVLKLKSDEVRFLGNAIDVSNDLYLTGYANYLELINSQKSKLTAEIDFLEVQHQNAKNNILLFKALGGKVKK